MKPVLARDLLRIVVFIPFYSQNLEAVIDRAWWWADDIFAVVPPDVRVDALSFETDRASSYQNLDLMQDAYDTCLEKTRIEEGDYICILYPDEVVVQSDALRPAIRNHHGKGIGLSMIAMHDESDYRDDHRSAGMVWPLFPYHSQGRFIDPSYQVRGPGYVHELERVQHPAATMLTYQFASPEQRKYWAGQLADPSLTAPPLLAKWTGGGTL